jgi:hypothetical protein
MAREYSTSKLKDLKPATAWAAVSYDTPPQIWEVGWHKENLQSNLRKVRVTVTPILPKRPAKKRRARATQ